MKKLLPVAVLLLVVNACGEEEESSGVISSKNLSISDFSADGTTSLDDGDMKDWIAEQDIHDSDVENIGEVDPSTIETGLVQGFTPIEQVVRKSASKILSSIKKEKVNLQSSSTSEDQVKCMMKLMTLNGGVGYMEMVIDGDLLSCFSSAFEGQEDLEINSFSASFYSRAECDSSDYTAIDGMNFYDLLYSEDEALKAELQQKTLSVTACSFDGSEFRSTSKMAMFMTMTQPSTGYKIEMNQREATLASDSSLCKFQTTTDNKATVSDCAVYVIEEGTKTADGKSETEKSYFKADLKGAVGEKDQEYYQSGSVSFTANSSSGTVELDGSSMPKFSVSHGGSTLTGYLEP